MCEQQAQVLVCPWIQIRTSKLVMISLVDRKTMWGVDQNGWNGSIGHYQRLVTRYDAIDFQLYSNQLATVQKTSPTHDKFCSSTSAVKASSAGPAPPNLQSRTSTHKSQQKSRQ